MPGKVVDASAWAAVGFLEIEGEEVVQRLQGFDLHAPRLIEYEITSTAWKKVRQSPRLKDAIVDQWRALRRVPLRLHDVDQDAALDLALETGLAAYDAAYLWLAESLGYELVTLDGPLQRAIRERRR
jgi:predicted nucleic acid-binding protein